jgi:serine/threonine-protein kinase
MQRDSMAQASACPSRDEMLAYARGALPLQQIEAVGNHIAGCPRCESSLRDIPPSDDTLVARLRQYVDGSSPVLLPTSSFLTETTVLLGASSRAEATVAGSFGKYRLVGKIGQGGMGVVFKAEDSLLGRTVALKMIRAGALASGDEVERFNREAKAIAQLRHTNIVQIYDFGEVGGQHYYTMELAEGGSLREQLGRFSATPRRAVGLLCQIARAVQHIHERDLLHRDLKPANILLGPDDQPRISDFGLARARVSDTELTGANVLLGTPAYMAPEQAGNQKDRIGPATDLWALGAILYEVLAGSKPFGGNEPDEILAAIRTQTPAPPRSLRPDLDRDLQTIILKCLEKEPARRYVSAGALADDLERWLRGDPILAKPSPWYVRLPRAARRRRLSIAILLLVFTGPVAVWLISNRLGDDELHRIQSALAAGERVTLVGATGPPRWHRWLAPGTMGPLSQEGCFTVYAGVGLTSLLELVPDGLPERFQFRAEVRQDSGLAEGQVGIFLGHVPYSIPKGTLHTFTRFCFAARDPGNKDKTKGYFMLVRFDPVHYSHIHGGGASTRSHTVFQERIFETDGLPLFVVARGYQVPAKPHWHKLLVKVTPQNSAVFFDGKILGNFSAADRLKAAKLMTVRREDMQGLLPQFPPDRGLGLFVDKCAASFRNVIVEPIGDDLTKDSGVLGGSHALSHDVHPVPGSRLHGD